MTLTPREGLPHAHILTTFAGEDKPHTAERIDKFISAEIPDETDPVLREQVLKRMCTNRVSTMMSKIHRAWRVADVQSDFQKSSTRRQSWATIATQVTGGEARRREAKLQRCHEVDVLT